MPKSNPWCHEHIIHKHGGTKIKYPTKRGKARWTKDGKLNEGQHMPYINEFGEIQDDLPFDEPTIDVPQPPDIPRICQTCGVPLEWSNIWTSNGTNTLCHSCWFHT